MSPEERGGGRSLTVGRAELRVLPRQLSLRAGAAAIKGMQVRNSWRFPSGIGFFKFTPGNLTCSSLAVSLYITITPTPKKNKKQKNEKNLVA